MAGPAVQVALRDRPRDHRHALERAGVLRPEKPASAQHEEAAVVRKLRCAVYTRKSSEEGLEQEFNSLDAQREACEAYIASQQAEGWVLVPDHYDDGGVSGGTLERPALKRLLADIEAGRVDVVVVYKIDRLSRALMDFAKLVEVFDRNSVTFVSVTQSFNTTTRMGRLTLNILLSFAQFEREVIGERIRDKFAASPQARHVDGRLRAARLRGQGPQAGHQRARGGDRPHDLRAVPEGRVGDDARPSARGRERPDATAASLIDKGFLYKLLNNRVYIGEAVHKGTAYPGEHEAIISRELWDKVHASCARARGRGPAGPARRRRRC